MTQPINLADPAFEPTDEQLRELSRRAFAGVRAKREAALATFREQTVAASAATFAQFQARLTRATSGE